MFYCYICYIYIYSTYIYIYSRYNSKTFTVISVYHTPYIYIYIYVFKEIKISIFEAIAFDVVFFNCIIHVKPILQNLTTYKL